MGTGSSYLDILFTALSGIDGSCYADHLVCRQLDFDGDIPVGRLRRIRPRRRCSFARNHDAEVCGGRTDLTDVVNGVSRPDS